MLIYAGIMLETRWIFKLFVYKTGSLKEDFTAVYHSSYVIMLSIASMINMVTNQYQCDINTW